MFSKLKIPKLHEEREFKPAEWLDEEIQARLDTGRTISIAVVGDLGSGKSWFAMELCRRNDPNFNIDRVLFDLTPFFDLVDNLPPRSFVQFDEAGVSVDAYQWASKLSKLLRAVSITYRYRQICTVYCVPDFSFIDVTHRTLTVCAIDVLDRGYADVYRIRSDHFGDLYLQYLVTIEDYPPPPKWLIEAYEKKKREAHQILMENVRLECEMLQPQFLRLYSEKKLSNYLDQIIELGGEGNESSRKKVEIKKNA